MKVWQSLEGKISLLLLQVVLTGKLYQLLYLVAFTDRLNGAS